MTRDIAVCYAYSLWGGTKAPGGTAWRASVRPAATATVPSLPGEDAAPTPRLAQFLPARRSLLIALSFLACLLAGSDADAQLQDPFGAALPNRETTAPKGTEHDAAHGVSASRGTAAYRVPIVVPPGRNGMQPHLSLNYSSDGALRGGIAVGWTLDGLPEIELDPRQGSVDPMAGAYRLRLGGGWQRLIEVADVPIEGTRTFRPEFDEEFARVEYVAGPLVQFVVRTPNGITHRFLPLRGPKRYLLDSTEDSFGNRIAYGWDWKGEAFGAWEESRLLYIEYTDNYRMKLGAHARIDFEYERSPRMKLVCPGSTIPIGAAADAHFGQRTLNGGRALISIVTRVRDSNTGPRTDNRPFGGREVRRITLDYDPSALSCSTDTAPLRYLERIRLKATSASGVVVEEPPLSFKYGPKRRTWDRTFSLGFGVGEYGTKDGTGGRLMDVDGDGIPEWTGVQVNARGQCELIAWKGVYMGETEGGGTHIRPFNPRDPFAGAIVMPLPTAPWAAGSWRNGGRPGFNERCTMDGQIVWQRDRLIVGRSRLKPADPTVIVYSWFDWDGDSRVDLVTHVYAGSGEFNSWLATDFGVPAGEVVNVRAKACPNNMVHVGNVPNPLDGQSTPLCACPPHQTPANLGTGFGGWECVTPGSREPTWPSPPDDCNLYSCDTVIVERLPEHWPGVPSDQSDSYLWRVYLNNGAEIGGLNSRDSTVDPVQRRFVRAIHPLPMIAKLLEPLVKPVGDASTSLPRVIDLDGDGVLDMIGWEEVCERVGDGVQCAVKSPFGQDRNQDRNLRVWRGKRSPLLQFSEVFGDDYEIWNVPLPDGFRVASGGTCSSGLGIPRTSWQSGIATLRDLNADGLPDLIVAQDERRSPELKACAVDNYIPVLVVLWNLGRGFSAPEKLGVTDYIDRLTTTLSGPTIFDGQREYNRRLIDVDADSIPDYLTLPYYSGSAEPTALISETDNVWRKLPRQWSRAKERYEAAGGNWSKRTEFRDVDGDGLEDLMQWTDGVANIITDSTKAGPPRKLVTIDNGRGMTVRFQYAPSTKPNVVRRSRSGAHTGSVRWVTSSVTVSPGGGQPPMITSYEYDNPVYTNETGFRNDPQSFVGFQSVTKTMPRPTDETPPARVRTSFTYIGGWPRAVVQETSLGGTLVTVTETDWKKAPLVVEITEEARRFPQFVYLERTLTKTCLSADCSNFATHRVTNTWRPWGQNTGTAGNNFNLRNGLYLHVEEREGTGEEPSNADRVTTMQYEVRYTGASPRDDYRVLPTETTTLWKGVVTGRTRIGYDTLGRPERTDVWVSADTVATTLRTFDGAGNVLTLRKPEQVTRGVMTASTTTYDSHGTYVASHTNELRHRIELTHDPGTGALLRRQGPNAIRVKGTPVWQTERWTVDGLGRPVEHFVSRDEPSAGYVETLIERTMLPSAAQPNRLVEERLQDLVGTTFMRKDTTVDGLGRIVSQTEWRSPKETAFMAAVYAYDATGSLGRLSVPDPRNDAGMVAYTYERDGLGRLLTLRKPDGSANAYKYAGFDDTLQEIGADGSTGATTVHRRDEFANLIEVHEHDNPLPGIVAITKYAYDDHDRLTTVQDADGVRTALAHDFAGRRTHVTRGSRTWTYEYDRNGNLTSEVPPLSAGDQPLFHVTRYEYDALDRVIVKRPAKRGLSETRLIELGLGDITYTYDGVAGAIGHLTRVDLPGGTASYTYDARGLPTKEAWSLRTSVGAASVTAEQFVLREYNALGTPIRLEYDNGQRFRIDYDTRGLPSDIFWWEGTWKRIARYTRARGGQPRKRSTDFAQERVWTYDVLGRVLTDTVRVGTNANVVGQPVSVRNYVYGALGEFESVSGFTGKLDARARYAYDARHRVTGATGPAGYSGAFTYSSTGNVVTSSVSWPMGADNRSVIYQYGAVDPQAVDALLDAGRPWAQFKYDPAGNMIERELRSGTSRFSWDAEGQLREAVHPSGSREIYGYDHNGGRVMAVHSTDGVRFWLNGSETHFDLKGNFIQRYVHIADDNGVLARTETVPTGQAALELEYSDAVRNLMLTVNANAELTSSFFYGAFGEVVASIGAETHRRQFNGKENDHHTGLRYYGARYYDPLLLRWNSGDPLVRFVPDSAIDQPTRLNLYAFSANNPVRYYDPSGLREEDFVVADPEGRWVYTWDDNQGWVLFESEIINIYDTPSPPSFAAWMHNVDKVVNAGGAVMFGVLALPVVVGASSAYATFGMSVGVHFPRATGVGMGMLRALTGHPEARPARDAFQIAKEGGRHAGFLKNYLGRSATEIRKGIASLEREIAKHRAKIANPGRALPNWDTLDPRQQQALLTEKWPSDIERLSEQADILRALLRGGQ